MPKNKKITLAIEAAIAGGSLALFDGGEMIGAHLGDGSISRAESLLVNISEMLHKYGVEKADLGSILVSLGPGSFTGIRIGIATALGLKDTLGIDCQGFATLEAIALTSPAADNIIAAVPVGKIDVACQWFSRDGLMFSDPVSDDAAKFIDYIKQQPSATVCAHTQVVEQFGELLSSLGVPVIDIGRNVASIISLAAGRHPGSHNLEPIYLRNSRYAGIG
jgi:tRNA threonylcarbamoyl adenosine modification protein YeaZ